GSPGGPQEPAGHLLQILDEMYRGYQDSRWVLDAGGDVPRTRETAVGMALVDAQLVAAVRRTVAHDHVQFDLRPYRALSEPVAAAVLGFCEQALAVSPHRVGKPLFGSLDGCHGARRGTYRVVYRINDHARTVSILDIDHRANVYRPQ